MAYPLGFYRLQMCLLVANRHTSCSLALLHPSCALLTFSNLLTASPVRNFITSFHISTLTFWGDGVVKLSTVGAAGRWEGKRGLTRCTEGRAPERNSSPGGGFTLFYTDFYVGCACNSPFSYCVTEPPFSCLFILLHPICSLPTSKLSFGVHVYSQLLKFRVGI
jgi:hypothetical protein